MSKKHRFLVAAAVVALIVGVAFAVFAMLPPQPGVTKVNFDRIEEGMTTQEVEGILGGTGKPFHGFANRGPAHYWLGVDGAVAFVEVSQDSVKSKMWRESEETILDKLRRWLRLPK